VPVSCNGKLIIVSGPSGSGKTTVLRGVFEKFDGKQILASSVSATTRPPRPGEVDGEDYHFLTKEDFDLRRQGGEFIECFEVFGRGHWYGTLKSEVSTGLKAGKWVVLEIDVQGAMDVMQSYPDATTIFVLPGSIEELPRRLRGRGTETEEALQRRLQQADSELALAGQYGYQVVNDDLDRAVQEICDILNQEIGGRPQ
jgi:guanylate kinase